MHILENILAAIVAVVHLHQLKKTIKLKTAGRANCDTFLVQFVHLLADEWRDPVDVVTPCVTALLNRTPVQNHGIRMHCKIDVGHVECKDVIGLLVLAYPANAEFRMSSISGAAEAGDVAR